MLKYQLKHQEGTLSMLTNLITSYTILSLGTAYVHISSDY